MTNRKVYFPGVASVVSEKKQVKAPLQFSNLKTGIRNVEFEATLLFSRVEFDGLPLPAAFGHREFVFRKVQVPKTLFYVFYCSPRINLL